MSRQRLNAQGWTIRQMRVSVGGARSVATAAWKVAFPVSGGRRWNAVPTQWAFSLHGGSRLPTRRVWVPYTEGLGFLHGETAFFAS